MRFIQVIAATMIVATCPVLSSGETDQKGLSTEGSSTSSQTRKGLSSYLPSFPSFNSLGWSKKTETAGGKIAGDADSQETAKKGAWWSGMFRRNGESTSEQGVTALPAAESTESETYNIERMDDKFLNEVFLVPSTGTIAKYLKNNPSQLFPNPQMGDVAVYFADVLNDLRFYHLQVTAEKGNKVVPPVEESPTGSTAVTNPEVAPTAKESSIPRPSIFLADFHTAVENVIKSLSDTDRVLAKRNIEYLIGAFVYLSQHRWEVLLNKKAAGDNDLPTVLAIFKQMLDLIIPAPLQNQHRVGLDYSVLGNCIKKRFTVKLDGDLAASATTRSGSSMFSMFSSRGKGDGGKQIHLEHVLIDFVPHLMALEAVAEMGKSGMSMDSLKPAISGLGNRCKGTDSASVSEHTRPEMIDRAVDLTIILRKYSADDLLDNQKWNDAVKLLNGGA